MSAFCELNVILLKNSICTIYHLFIHLCVFFNSFPLISMLNYQHIQQPLLQSKVSHDPSEINLIWCFGNQKNLIIITAENGCAD